MKRPSKRAVRTVALVLLGIFIVLQFIKRPGPNPPVEPGADFLTGTNAPPAAVAKLLRGACYDCHSHETITPWYGHVAPVSWWLADHIQEGRDAFNFSEWPEEPAAAAKRLNRLGRAVKSGFMPLKSYTWMHPEARLTEAEKQLIAEWTATESARLKASE